MQPAGGPLRLQAGQPQEQEKPCEEYAYSFHDVTVKGIPEVQIYRNTPIQTSA
jgi:hypothetical protein